MAHSARKSSDHRSIRSLDPGSRRHHRRSACPKLTRLTFAMALDRCAVSLTGLADDVLLSCLSFVAGEDLCRLSQTCTRLQQQLHSQAAFVWRRAYHVKWEGRGSLRSEPGRARFVLALATKRPQHPDTFSQHMAFQRPILMIKVWSSSLTDPWRVHGVLLETFFVPRHHRPHDGTIFSLS